MDKGVIIEYDFTAIDGAQLLFDTARKFFEDLDGIKLDAGTEARYLAGQNYLLGLTAFFATLKTKKTAAKAAKDLPVAFQKALGAKIAAEGLAPEFVQAVKALEDKGLKIVIATRADIASVKDAFAPVLSDNVKLYFENSITYGNVKWDAWRRAAKEIGVAPQMAAVVTGSGFGVKSALLASFHVAAVHSPHVAWQDFGGANYVGEKFDNTLVERVLRTLRV